MPPHQPFGLTGVPLFEDAGEGTEHPIGSAPEANVKKSFKRPVMAFTA